MPVADPDFIVTLGREFATRMNPVAGSDWLGAADVHEIFDDLLGEPLGPERLRQLRQDEVQALAVAFNAFLESEAVTEAHVRDAIAQTLWHWDE